MEHQLFSDRLIKLRMDGNLTQKDLADAIFVSRSAVAKWEQGRGLPDAKTLCEIARYFGISIEKLIEDTELEDTYVPSNKYSDGVMKRIQLCLKSKDFSKAYDLVELVLNNDSSNSKAYLLAVLIEYQFSSIKELRESTVEIQKNVNFLHALQFASEEEKKELLEIEKQIEENTNQLKLQKCYDLGVLYFQKKDYKKAKSYFSLVEDFSHAQEYIQKCEDQFLFEKERNYRCAKRLMRSRLLSKLSEAEKIFTSLNDYKDSQELLTQVQQSKKKCRQQVIFYSSLSSSIAFLCVLFILLTCLVFVPNRKRYETYQDAITTYEAGNYEEALLEFEKVGNYREAKKYKTYSQIYCKLEDEKYSDAKQLTLSLKDGTIAHRLFADNDSEPLLLEYQELDYFLPRGENQNGKKFAYWNDFQYQFDDETETLYIDSKAVYDLIDYKITYVLNGGENHHLNETSFNISDFTIRLWDASKEDCNFLGWYDNPEFSGQPIKNIVPSKTFHDVTLYAKFAWIEYKITYILNGGTNHPDNPASYTKWDDTFYLRYPTYEGYAFVGWENEYGTIVAYISPSSKRDITLTARWSLESIPVYYHVLDGSSWDESWENPNPTTIKYKKSFELKDPILPEDKVFLGWFTSVKSLGNVSYEQTTTVNYNQEGREKIDVYAEIIDKYKPICYHNLDESWENPNPSTVTYNETLSLKDPILPEDKVFLGWFYNLDNQTTQVSRLNYDNANNKDIVQFDLYAKIVNRYKTIYYHNVEEVVDNPNPNQVEYGGDPILLNNLQREGHTFFGWSSNANLQNSVESISYDSADEIHLYAKWGLDVLPVYYHIDEQTTNPVENLQVIHYGESFTLQEPTKDGFFFLGWKKDNVGDYITTLSYQEYIEGNEIHLYPIWTTENCTIEYVIPYGSNHPDNPSSILFSTSVTLKNPTVDDKYTFMGWKNEEGAYVTAIEFNEQNPKNHYVLTASYDSVGTALVDHRLNGEGTKTNPFQITTVEQFVYLNRVNVEGEYFILMNDLDFAGYTFPQYVVDDFSGYLDGGNHTIKNLKVPLFHDLNNATISNLLLSFIQVEFSINSSHATCGILSHLMMNSTLDHVEMDENCSITCYFMNNNSLEAKIGMLSGDVGSCTIKNCKLFSKLEVIANELEDSYIGGFFGEASGENIISDSLLSGNMTYFGEKGSLHFGGMIGYLTGDCEIRNIQLNLASTLEGKFTSSTEIAGVIGMISIGYIQNVTMNDCDINFQVNVNNGSENKNINFCGIWGGDNMFLEFTSQKLHIEENITLSSSHGKDGAYLYAIGFISQYEIQLNKTTIIMNADIGSRRVETDDESYWFTSPSSYQYNINPQNPTA